ncbi:MAG: glycosyltransferase family 4 protein [Chloroflexota bacterium]
MAPKIAYIVSRFPHLPETFILREMAELERRGWQIALYPLIRQKQKVVHDEAITWIGRMRYIPFFSLSVLWENLLTFFQAPQRYVALFSQAVKENLPSPKFLLRAALLFPKGVCIARKMQMEGITHIHSHYATHTAFVAWLVHRLINISYSITVHAHDIFVDQTMLDTKVREAVLVVSISKFNCQFLYEYLGAWALDKTVVIHCGIELDHYTPQQRRQDQGKRLEIINIGSLQPYKGHSYLIQAGALLRDRGVPFRIRIIGEGEVRADLERLIVKTGLGSHVELLGAKPQAEVPQLLATANCYVQPSVITPQGKMEGLPVALMEAMAMGLPVVATDLSAISELVRESETGSLVPPGDAEALADRLQAIFFDRSTAERMALRGRKVIEQEFDLLKNVTQLEKQFYDILQAEPFPVVSELRNQESRV